MSNTIKVRRGVAATLPTLEAGQWGFTTDTHKVYIGDGTTNYLVGPASAASDTVQGIIELATQAEVDAGTDTVRAITPATLKATTCFITAAPGTDHVASGLILQLVAAATMAFGDVCYINSSGQAAFVDADAIASGLGIVMCADATITASATGNFLMYGIARDDTWVWTVGGAVYITVTGTTANTLSQTQPTGTDDVIQIVGIATHVDRMLFAPNLATVEHT